MLVLEKDRGPLLRRRCYQGRVQGTVGLEQLVYEES
jgi:hypothetical protein